MKCRYCGCTDQSACQIPIAGEPNPLDGETPMLAAPGAIAEFVIPCSWLSPNICTAPACVEAAYHDACLLMNVLSFVA